MMKIKVMMTVFSIGMLFVTAVEAQTIKVRVHGGSKAVEISGDELTITSEALGIVNESAALTMATNVARASRPLDASSGPEAPVITKLKIDRVESGLEGYWKLTIPTASSIRGPASQSRSAGRTERLLPSRSSRAPASMFLEQRRLEGASFDIAGKNLKLNGKAFPSPITFLLGARTKINAIIQIPLEDYVAGVVAGEMPASWPLNALMAQAIASRSYVLAQLAAQDQQLFHTDSSQLNQVFKWINEKQAPDENLLRVREAVKKTEGRVLTDSKGQPLWAYYHADCGGHTEEPDHVWSNHQRYGTVRDQSCPVQTKSRWEASLSLQTANQKLKPVLAKNDKIVGLDVGEKTPSGRVKNVVVKFEDGSRESIRGNQFRQQLGFDWIKSTMFGMSQRGTVYHLKGQGYGHGVGLCQWGTRELAKQGKSYMAILKNYYPKAKIEVAKVLP